MPKHTFLGKENELLIDFANYGYDTLSDINLDVSQNQPGRWGSMIRR